MNLQSQVAGQARFKAANLESVSYGEVFRRGCVKPGFI